LLADSHALSSSADVSCDACIRLAVDLGMFEAAVCDALMADAEGLHPVGVNLRGASAHAAHAYLAALGRDPDAMRTSAARVETCLACLDAGVMPQNLLLRKPEGFAYYGLYPESYVEAVLQAASRWRPRHAASVGIRSIGTTLSAFVAAALERSGAAVTSWTVRPTGHPFDRRVRIAEDLARVLTLPSPDLVFIADEGPGLSGSSFAAVAEELERIGIPADRLILLPAWTPEGGAFVSSRAAAWWRRLQKITVPFERTWIENGRLAAEFNASELQDISAGQWRRVFRPVEDVAIQPQHERRKYLARASEGHDRIQLIKFAGLGRLGDTVLERAGQLDGAPIARPSRLAAGFCGRDVVVGHPMKVGDVDRDFLVTAGEYLCTVAERCALDADSSPEALLPLLETNANELLPGASLRGLSTLLREARRLPRAPAVQLDARMLPHEWLRTPGGYIKVDALEHHDDHFFPGPQDIAWDVASTIVEFELNPRAAGDLVETIARRLRDRTLPGRLRFYTAAYLAFRAGYCSLGAAALGLTDDGANLASAATTYTDRLRQVVLHA
jgi:hypothetical protein